MHQDQRNDRLRTEVETLTHDAVARGCDRRQVAEMLMHGARDLMPDGAAFRDLLRYSLDHYGIGTLD